MVDRGPIGPQLYKYVVGVDFGQSQDFTAIATIQVMKDFDTKAITYELVGMERPPLGTDYNKIVAYLKDLVASPVIRGPHLTPDVVVDSTGCGRPVVDMLKAAGLRSPSLVPCNITGGQALTHEGGFYGVPKRELAVNLQILFQDSRIKIAKELPLVDILTQELLNFKVKININTGNDSFEAWREGDHDDMVLAVALACWYEEYTRKRTGSVQPLPAGLRW